MSKITTEQIEEKLAEKELNFTVTKRNTPHPVSGYGPTGFYTSMRNDTKKVFAQGLTKRWKPIQNFDAFRCISDISKEEDIKLVNALSFDGGALVAMQISLGEFSVGNKDDKIQEYLTVINSHNGKGSMYVLATPRRIFCKNQLNSIRSMARKEKAIVTIQHTVNAEHRMEELAKSVELGRQEFQKTCELYNTLAERKINETYVRDVLARLFPLEEDASEKTKTIHEKKLKYVREVYQNANQGRIEKDTAWNLYNSVQHMHQHMGSEKVVDSPGRMKSVMLGDREKKSSLALATVMEMTAPDYLSTDLTNEIDKLTN